MENRFSTMTEVRNVLWPSYETPEYDAANFLQGIAGTLELFHRSALAFQELAEEATGHPVAVFQRIDQAGYRLPIDERILADTDTLMVFGLDHLLSEQEAAPEEIAIAEAIARLRELVDSTVEWVEHRWAGLRSFAPDRLPVYGFDPRKAGFFWFAGQGGFGIQTAPAGAALGAALLLDRWAAIIRDRGSVAEPGPRRDN